MRSRWIESEAQAAIDCHSREQIAPEFALRIYSTRLLGQEPGLVQHGGGNTSLKNTMLDVFGEAVEGLPVSNELKRYARALLRARRPEDGSPRSIHRFRRETEPWALDALVYAGAPELADAVRAARERDPAEPLLRGDELGLPPGPEIGRLLDLIEEERAAGTISTREDALELVRREAAGSEHA